MSNFNRLEVKQNKIFFSPFYIIPLILTFIVNYILISPSVANYNFDLISYFYNIIIFISGICLHASLNYNPSNNLKINKLLIISVLTICLSIFTILCCKTLTFLSNYEMQTLLLFLSTLSFFMMLSELVKRFLKNYSI